MDLDQNKIEEQKPTNEGEYLEMVSHLKQIYDNLNDKCFKMEIKEMEYKKILMTTYGLARVIDVVAEGVWECPPELNILIETLRAHCSDALDVHIFNIVEH